MEQATMVDLTPLWDILILLAVAILTALAGWVSLRVTSYFKLKSDDVVRGYLDEILNRGIAFAEGQMRQAAARYDAIEVRNEVVGAAVTYALKQAPDAVARFGLTPAQVQAMVSARLGKTLPASPSAPVLASNDNASNDNNVAAQADPLVTTGKS